MKNIIKTATTSMLILCGSAAVSAPQGSAIIAFSANNDGLSAQAASDLDCTILRAGDIQFHQGPMQVGAPKSFTVLECDAPILSDPAARSLLSDTLSVFEGDLAKLTAIDKVEGRQYILKLSTYNNLDLDGRDAELISLDTEGRSREGRWETEFFLNVDDAMGAPTLDEVVVLSYDSAEVADKFRNDNQDLLEMVGRFNHKHLIDFVYLGGAAK